MALRQLCSQLRMRAASAAASASATATGTGTAEQQSLWRCSQQLALVSRRQRLGTALQQQQQRSSSSGTGGGSVGKRAEQLSDEELKAALPSMLFTTSNLIWSTTLAVGVAAAGLVCMFWVGTFITGAAQSLRHLEAQPAAPAPPPPRSLAELILERKAELQAQLAELEGLPRTPEVKAALAAARKELRQFRAPGEGGWWSLWR